MSPPPLTSDRKRAVVDAISETSPEADADFRIPCVRSPVLSSIFKTDIWLCDVTLGPTSSWKDCVAPGVITAALRHGSRRVVVASSGNHGRAIAFACRDAGLQAAVLVYDRTPPDVIASLTGLGAEVFCFPDRAAVHAAMDVFIADNWFSATLTDRLRERSSMPGCDGYRRIAVAIANAVEVDPIVIVPTCYGDGASSIRRHLVTLGRQPDMCLVRASEAKGSLAASIATNVLTPQVARLLASGAMDFMVEDRSFEVGLKTMAAAVGKPLDCAEGGIYEALTRFALRTPSLRPRPIVCVITGGIFRGRGQRPS